MSIQPGSSKLAGRHSVPEIQKKQKSQIKKILLQLLNYQGALSVGYHRQYSFYRRRLFTAYIAFCQDINHLNLMKSCLEQWFLEARIACNFYEVHCKNPEKDDQFNAFMDDDKLAVCLSVAMLSEGVHGFDGVILLRDTISPNLYYQQIGRVFAVDMDTVPIIFDLVANCESIMECNLKNDLLEAIDKKDKEKIDSENACVNDGQNSNKANNSNECNTKEITRDDIESFFVFDQVIDAVNAFKEIEGRIKADDWTREDEEIIRQHYAIMGTNVKSMLLTKRSKNSIKNKAWRMGIIYGVSQ